MTNREDWLKQLPAMIDAIRRVWRLKLSAPFLSGAAWIARAELANGAAALLKLGMPHMEAEHEIQGMLFWDGDPTARVIKADVEWNALLLERCEPGIYLRQLPEPEQDAVVASLLRRLWRTPAKGHPFRPIAEMLRYWSSEVPGTDSGLVAEGLRLFGKLPLSAPRDVLLATDLHAGNILAARREPWLVIDPKPFMGDPAYDVTQHLLNCRERMLHDPVELIRRMSDLSEVEYERVLLWTFARAAAIPDDEDLRRLAARLSSLI